ncbi:hypothetical protein BaRGS_00027086 [Batillaria attramentaria]|uniref:Uncharacterized protein n=1 Tax=Batillaria attramentaria TaxID=370345 RepID=A0ABD0K3T0_9CAEN
MLNWITTVNIRTNLGPLSANEMVSGYRSSLLLEIESDAPLCLECPDSIYFRGNGLPSDVGEMAESLIQSVIKCPICLEAYEDPRMLPCLHSFCLKCLRGYIENCRMGPSQTTFTCPVCREAVRPPNPHCPIAEWSTQFRSNFIMTDLASCLNEVSKVKEEGSGKGEVCLPCSKQMQYPKEAEQFCLDCSQPYCETCLQVHMTIPSCQTHSIVAIDDHTAREVHQKHHQQCSEHPEEVLKMFCEDCSALLCPVCALLKHRQCSKMNSVMTMASARRLHLETAQRDLLQSLQQAREMQKKLKKEKEDLAKQSSSSLRDVDEAYEALVTKVKDQKQNDLLKMREAMNAVHKHLTGHEEDINAYVSLLEEDVTKLQSRQLIVSDTQLLREVKLCDCKEAESAATDVSTYVDKISRCQYSLPSLNKAKLEELHKTLGKMTLTFGGPDSQAAGAQCANLAGQTTTVKPSSPALFTLGLPGAGKGSSVGRGLFSLPLQLGAEGGVAWDALSSSSSTEPPSSSSTEGLAGLKGDSQRNPFSLVSVGKRGVRRPAARPRNSLARRALSGSVFSVKHPVVTAANTTPKQASPRKSSTNPGFSFVPVKSCSAIISQFKPAPKLRLFESPSGASETPSNPKPSASGDATNVTLKSFVPTSDSANSLPPSTSSVPAPTKQANSGTNKGTPTTPQAEPPSKLSKNFSSLNSPSGSVPSNVNIASGGSASSSKNGRPESIGLPPSGGASAAAAANTAEDTNSAVPGETGSSAKTDDSAKGNGEGEGADSPCRPSQKLRSTFKIFPASAGDLRRPIISDFAVLPNDRLALIDRANNRLKLVQLNGESQDGQFPSVDLNKPHGVCHMTGDVVAVVSHVNKTLQLVSLQGPQPGVQHTHNTCRGYLNIARLTPDILAARFSLGVHVLDVGGPALRLKAAIVNDNNGKPLFQSPMSMCTTSDGKIVILDGMLLEISCWDRSGVPIWRVVHSNLHFPRSLCTVGLRRLYCMCNTTRLDCLTTSTGKLLHSVKLDTKEAPLKEVSSIAQDSQGRILVNTSEEIVCFTWI